MSTRLRVLLIDDSADDSALVIHALGQSDVVVEWSRVASPSELLSALARDWDVVLLDWHMPGWGGYEALTVLSAKGQTVPVVVVSGALPEPAVIARAMERGAAAFVAKDDRAKLGQVIDQVLLQAGGSLLERTAAYLLGYPELAMTILDAVPTAILAVNARGFVRFANEEAGRLTGYSRAELVDAPVEVLLAEHRRDRHGRDLRPRYFDDPRERVLGATAGLPLRRKDGTTIHVGVTLRPVLAREGILAIVVVRRVS